MGSPEPARAAPAAGTTADLPGALILIVDDEPEMREAARQMVELLGLETLTAVDGLDAVEQVRRDPTVDLVLMDLTMPRMDGRDAFRLLKRLRPGLPVILSSGFNEKESIRGVDEEGLAGFLKKPYTLHALREKLVAVLGRPRSRSFGLHRPSGRIGPARAPHPGGPCALLRGDGGRGEKKLSSSKSPSTRNARRSL